MRSFIKKHKGLIVTIFLCFTSSLLTVAGIKQGSLGVLFGVEMFSAPFFYFLMSFPTEIGNLEIIKTGNDVSILV